MKRVGLVVVGLLVLVIGVPLAASRMQGFEIPYENFPYNGNFTFVRVRFEPTRWGSWSLSMGARSQVEPRLPAGRAQLDDDSQT